MKNLLLLCFSLILLTSCELTEKVYIEEDGAVKYALDIDMSQLKMIDKKEGKNKDNVKAPIDTILTVQELRESDIEDVEKMGRAMEDERISEMFEDFKFHLIVNENHSSISVYMEKPSITALNQSLDQMEHTRQDYIAKMKDSLSADELASMDMPIQSNLNLFYTENTFERKGVYENKLGDGESLNMGEMETIISSLLTYNIEYHFPKPITSISDPSALTSFDRKIVYIRKPMHELMENPEAYNFKVTFD